MKVRELWVFKAQNIFQWVIIKRSIYNNYKPNEKVKSAVLPEMLASLGLITLIYLCRGFFRHILAETNLKKTISCYKNGHLILSVLTEDYFRISPGPKSTICKRLRLTDREAQRRILMFICTDNET